MPDDQTMACMEVWGGSEAVDAHVSLSGLDAWVYSRPYQQAAAGGDVYYVSACATGRINRLLVADVSGHGESVRGVAVQLRDLMRRFVNYLDQTRFVTSMNRQFVECSAAGCFATALVTTFFAPTRSLSVCNAGHPPPLLYRAATRTWSLLEADAGNIPLGILEFEDCDQFAADLDVGDLVLVYTDSLMEATPPGGDILGTSGLLKIVQETADASNPASLISNLLTTIDDRTAGGLRADDVTALLLRPNGTGRRVSWSDSLAAPLRILRTAGAALLGRGPFPWPELSLANIGGAVLNRFNERHRRPPRARRPVPGPE
jgi:phosphoserine phosphatase RsbU/P